MESMNLSPFALFTQAGPVGKTVIALLGIASLICWIQIVEGIISLFRLHGSVRSLRKGLPTPLLQPVIDAGLQEHHERFDDESVSERRGRIVEAMNRQARNMFARMEAGLPNLAVIASVAPFIGLFGTVWGIMASFTAIAEANDTSLAVVAPGIAEALATTAFGLAAAIPASIAYSRIGSSFAAQAQDVSNLIEETALRLMRGHAIQAVQVVEPIPAMQDQH